MRNISVGALLVMLSVAVSQPVFAQRPQAEKLQGKFTKTEITITTPNVSSTAELEALQAFKDIVTPLDHQITFSEYKLTLKQAKQAIDQVGADDSLAISNMRSALKKHLLALQFFQDCQQVRNDFFCDEKIPSVAMVMRLLPHPRNIEQISRQSVVEALQRYPRPWVATRVRATLREVVEYIPTSEQNKVLTFLWTQADADVKNAAIALGRP